MMTTSEKQIRFPLIGSFACTAGSEFTRAQLKIHHDCDMTALIVGFWPVRGDHVSAVGEIHGGSKPDTVLSKGFNKGNQGMRLPCTAAPPAIL